MACLDTDIMVALLRGEEKAINKIAALEFVEPLSTTPVNATELFKGAFRSKFAQDNVSNVQKLLGNLRILDYNLESSKLSGRIIENLRKNGKTLDDFDAIIAAIVVTHNESLVTRNVKHFQRVPGLKVIKW
jgi:predicted nucleic acid-binding protein